MSSKHLKKNVQWQNVLFNGKNLFDSLANGLRWRLLGHLKARPVFTCYAREGLESLPSPQKERILKVSALSRFSTEETFKK